ncbi:MAG: hypothetical protein P1U86_13320 [Verrucomicrobiales bacterium]|nr:hypothetical protein [Verrucomicrobiales bacterium]
MQQTALDRWLRKKFVYYTQVYCNTLPREIPPRITVEETTKESGGRFLYRLTTNDDASLLEISKGLERENITYTSRVAEKKGLAARLFNDPFKSFTYRVAWIIFILIIISIILSGLPVYLWKTYTELPEDKEEARMEVIESTSLLSHVSSYPYYYGQRLNS